MTESIRNFLATNKHLLDTDMNEFFFSADNGLSISQQKELVSILDEVGISTINARESVLRFIITMDMQVLERPVALKTLILRYYSGRLGFSADWVYDYIRDNAQEWDITIKNNRGDLYVYPPRD